MIERKGHLQAPGTGPSGMKDVVRKNFAQLHEAIAFDEHIDSGVLKHAFQLGDINQEQYGKLAVKLLEKTESQLKQSKEEVGRLSIDAATGLLGGNLLIPDLTKLLEGLKHDSTLNAVMVIALDMDGLKYLNDTYDHDVGDQALIALANRLKEKTKVGDLAFRPKGKDEYTVILPIRELSADADFDEVFKNIKDRFQHDLSITIETEKGSVEFPITFSIGYSVARKGESKDAKELLKEADRKERENKKMRRVT